MHADPEFITSLATVLCVAALTTVLFQRLRQPVVFGYLLAGMIIGPHIPLPLVADEATVHTLAELGVILLLFGLGLEFSLRKLIRVGPTAGLVAVAQSSLMVWFGYLAGQAFGWTQLESVYAGAIIAISSTTIIVKAFAEQRIKGKVAELVFGILVIEDLIGIFLIAILTAVSAGAGLSTSELAATAVRLVTFLAGLIGVGLLVIPRVVRYVVRLDRPETTLVASIGICFASALLALAFGYSVALGAFIAGSLVAESGEELTVEHLVAPVRDMFAAIFFVAVGMLIDPVVIAEHWVAAVVFTVLVVLGKVVAVSASAFLTGLGVRTSVQAGMSLAQIGEFSFIIAGVGIATGATRGFLYPVAIAVSAVTTLSTPWLIRVSGPVASRVDHALPGAMQTFVTLYGSWLERLRGTPGGAAARSRTRRFVRVLLLDAALLAALVVGVSLEMARATALLTRAAGFTDVVARWLVIAGAAVVAVPLAAGILRSAFLLGRELALRTLPTPEQGVDFAVAPRRMLEVTLQLGILALVIIPLLAVTQPFVPLRGAAIAASLLLLLFAAVFWRSLTNLQGHARAGAQLILAALAEQMASEPQAARVAAGHAGEEETPPAIARTDTFAQVHRLLPGMGEPEPVRIEPGSPAVNRSLAELDLRSQTGATVLAIRRGTGSVVFPTGQEVLQEGDVLALAGSQEALDAARQLLEGGAAPEAA